MEKKEAEGLSSGVQGEEKEPAKDTKQEANEAGRQAGVCRVLEARMKKMDHGGSAQLSL